MIPVEAARALACALPEAVEQDHFGRPSFRVRGKIFATLWPDERRVVIKASLDQQSALVGGQPDTFSVTPWGHQGWTAVELDRVDPELFRELLVDAWRRVAPKRLVAEHDRARLASPGPARRAGARRDPRTRR